MTRLILIRHGQSVWNAKNIFTGWVDVDLTSAGKQEAKQSGELINKINFKPQICFTSYLKRFNKETSSSNLARCAPRQK